MHLSAITVMRCGNSLDCYRVPVRRDDKVVSRAVVWVVLRAYAP